MIGDQIWRRRTPVPKFPPSRMFSAPPALWGHGLLRHPGTRLLQRDGQLEEYFITVITLENQSQKMNILPISAYIV